MSITSFLKSLFPKETPSIENPSPIPVESLKENTSLPDLPTLHTAEEKGADGERLAAFHAIPIYGFGKQLRNLYLPLPNGQTTELDMVVVHTSGVYVVEVKNYRGWIFGNDKDKYWTQSFSKEKKYRFYNPVRQNEAHIKTLQKLLPCDASIFSFIVFGKECELKKITVARPNTYVIRLQGLTNKLKMVMEENPNILSSQQVVQIHQALQPYARASEEEKQRHIQYVESLK